MVNLFPNKEKNGVLPSAKIILVHPKCEIISDALSNCSFSLYCDSFIGVFCIVSCKAIALNHLCFTSLLLFMIDLLVRSTNREREQYRKEAMNQCTKPIQKCSKYRLKATAFLCKVRRAIEKSSILLKQKGYLISLFGFTSIVFVDWKYFYTLVKWHCLKWIDYLFSRNI